MIRYMAILILCALMGTGCLTGPEPLLSETIGPMVPVPGGKFHRDSRKENVSVLSPFYISECEITRIQFRSVMGVDPSDLRYSSGKTDPVQNINWYIAIAFCNKLSLSEGLEPIYSVSGVDFRTLD